MLDGICLEMDEIRQRGVEHGDILIHMFDTLGTRKKFSFCQFVMS